MVWLYTSGSNRLDTMEIWLVSYGNVYFRSGKLFSSSLEMDPEEKPGRKTLLVLQPGPPFLQGTEMGCMTIVLQLSAPGGSQVAFKTLYWINLNFTISSTTTIN